jgi:hypothetical protein
MIHHDQRFPKCHQIAHLIIGTVNTLAFALRTCCQLYSYNSRKYKKEKYGAVTFWYLSRVNLKQEFSLSEN